MTMPTTTTPHTIGRNEGERADFPQLGSRYILRPEDTDGAFSLIEHTIPPHTLAAPMHVHEREDEFSFVLSGRMGAQIGDDVVEAGLGELVRKPRGVPHAFWNPGEEETRVLELISPGAFAQYFADLAPLLSAAGTRDIAALTAIRTRYALTMDLGSIESLTERHGLHT